MSSLLTAPTSSSLLSMGPIKSSTIMGEEVVVKKRRNLIVCFDGTSSQYDGDNTNVVKLYALLKKDNPEEQLCYYQPGVGTYIQPGVVSPLFMWGAKVLDLGVAWYLDAHVRGGYTFLMQNYREGDKICIFGFSRGAYTARALAGLIHKIGLLPKDNPEQVPFAYKLYKRTDPASLIIAAGFKQTFCRAVEIEFVGVWDTVASVGVLIPRHLPFTTSNTTIKTFRHALSLDERRTKFRPNLYHRPAPDAAAAQRDPNQASVVVAKKPSIVGLVAQHIEDAVSEISEHLGSSRRSKDKSPAAKTPPLPETAENDGASDTSSVDIKIDPGDKDEAKCTDVLEVWFAGCHSDVGGGAVPNATKHCLGDITLRWMVRQVVLSQVGVKFDNEALMRANIPPALLGGVALIATPPRRKSPSPSGSPNVKTISLGIPGPSRAPELDATAQRDGYTAQETEQPIHDELKERRMWWILEMMPLAYAYQDGEGRWHRKISMNFGRGRQIPDIGPLFHTSVRDRMQNPNLKYRPKAAWKEGTESYVS